VIARVWTARAATANAPGYAEHLRTHVLPALRQVAGYSGALLLERPDGAEVELVVLTWWQSLESITGFAGADVETAVVADEAAALLAGYDERVRHYELVLRDDG
jgi:heme-degrading monooxygenase HmoA